MIRSVALVALGGLLAGCGPTLVGPGGDLGPFFVVAGPLDPQVPALGGDVGAAIVWAYVAQGEGGVVVERTTLERRPAGYALEVVGPPSTQEPIDTFTAPEDLATLTVSWGLPILLREASAGSAEVEVNADALLDWLVGASDLESAVTVRQGSGVGATSGHLLIALAGGAVGPAHAPWCRFDAAGQGLTLYRDAGPECGGWLPMAPAGARTEFQGIPMRPWGADRAD